ncbi:HAD family hydrolase [Arcanobacterium haemolyticum]|nr:HAD family hydrolase [Arcanobacterium haemolyticum]
MADNVTPVPTPSESYVGRSPELVLVDMDGTLLNSQGAFPDGLWDLLSELRERRIPFVPASGRQYQKLRHMFDDFGEGMPFIADNGAYVVRDGDEVSSMPLSRDFVVSTVHLLRRLIDEGQTIAIVVAGKKAAYVECDDPVFLQEVDRYYWSNSLQNDVLDYDDDILKIAIFDFGNAEAGIAPHIMHLRATHAVVISGVNWVDIMDRRVSKGAAARALMAAYGADPAGVVAFGDYLNDSDMLEAVGLSFAVANAHPEVIKVARFVAPSNDDNGVMSTLRHLLDGTTNSSV